MSDARLQIAGPADTTVILSAVTDPVHVEDLGPRSEIAWDAYVELHPAGSIFHTLAWRNAVQRVFGHQAYYLTACRGPRIVGVLPLFLLASRYTGRRLISVPYGVEGGILADDDEAAGVLYTRAKALLRETKASLLELRSAQARVPELPVREGHVNFSRRLPDRAEDVVGWLPRKARAAARQGRDKFGLVVSYGDEHLRTVWRLYCVSMRRLASINYPRRLFEALATGLPGRHWTSLVTWNGTPVAGLFTLMFRDRVSPYFIGTTDAARRCHAPNLIYRDLMERAVAHGYRVFDFGRTRVGNTGSFDFKRFHGFAPRLLEYQQYVPRSAKPVVSLSPANPRIQLARKVWSHLPLAITQPAGAWLSRHIPG